MKLCDLEGRKEKEKSIIRVEKIKFAVLRKIRADLSHSICFKFINIDSDSAIIEETLVNFERNHGRKGPKNEIIARSDSCAIPGVTQYNNSCLLHKVLISRGNTRGRDKRTDGDETLR